MLAYLPLIMTERKCSVGDTLSLIHYIILAIACTYVNRNKKRLVIAVTSLILFATKESVFR